MSQRNCIMKAIEDLDDTALMKEVGRRIAFLRRSSCMKQEELSKKAGISRYALSRLENGAGGIWNHFYPYCVA